MRGKAVYENAYMCIIYEFNSYELREYHNFLVIILYIKKRRESGRGRVGQRWLHELCGGGEGVGGFGCRCGCSNLFLILMLASTGTKLKVLSFFGPP